MRTEIGDKVSFCVDDVFLPNPEALVAPDEIEVEGTVVGFSDSGSAQRVFAVVEVIRRQTVVVPVEKLQPLPPPSP